MEKVWKKKKCCATTNRNKPCQKMPKSGSEYCYIHDNSANADIETIEDKKKCGAKNHKNKPCKKMPIHGSIYCVFHKDTIKAEMETIADKKKCCATTIKNEPCKKIAEEGSNHCFLHNRKLKPKKERKTAPICDCKSKKMAKQISMSKYLCEHNNFKALYPNIAEEWDNEKNEGKLPENYLPGSDVKISWRCRKGECDCHVWVAGINERVSGNNGCPYCSGTNKKVCRHNNFTVLYPDLLNEWNYEKNEGLKPEDYAPRSDKKVYWTCPDNPCGCHVYEAQINSRTLGKGCHFCCNQKVCRHANLIALRPDLAEQWNFDKNFDIDINEISPGSNKKVWWICQNDPSQLHVWKTSVKMRATGRGCPRCAKSKGYSENQIKWLSEIEKRENIQIQHALSECGEFYIKDIGNVDGFCKSTNTVYEYHGDFWHGNIDMYDRDKIHPVIGTTYGSLYQKTILRDDKIRKLGYNLVIVWESEFLNGNF